MGASEIILDPKIRDWVLIPLTIIMVFMGLARHYAAKLMRKVSDDIAAVLMATVWIATVWRATPSLSGAVPRCAGLCSSCARSHSTRQHRASMACCIDGRPPPPSLSLSLSTTY
jgi:hypothetical protein